MNAELEIALADDAGGESVKLAKIRQDKPFLLRECPIAAHDVVSSDQSCIAAAVTPPFRADERKGPRDRGCYFEWWRSGGVLLMGFSGSQLR